MRVVIIGANGMLGQELAAVYADRKPILLSRQQLDITDENMVRNEIGKINADLIINASAYNDVDGAEREKAVAENINGYGVGYLAKAARASQSILVHYSTDYVFDGTKKEGYNEDERPKPISSYGRSKYLGELELQKYSDKYYLIRLSRLFGKPSKSYQGKKSFIEKIIELSKKKKEIEIIDGELSSPTYAHDVAQQTRYVIEQKKDYGIYHITNEGACTWYEFAKEIFTLKNINATIKPVSVSYFNRAAKRPLYSILLNTKLPPMRKWQAALKHFLI